MPRKGLVSRREQAVDPVFSSDLVEKFICSMMWDGKKSTAQRVFYGAMDQVAKKTNDEAFDDLTRKQFEGLPLRERVSYLIEGTAQFFLDGQPIAATEAMRT